METLTDPISQRKHLAFSEVVPVLLVEDEPLWQEGIRDLFLGHSRLRLIDTVDSFEGALVAFERHNPEIVLLDWKIRGVKDGLEVGHELMLRGLPPERFVLISGSPSSSIPPHPFLIVPKRELAGSLIPLLESVTKD